ncbi:MAG: hypothetical protein KA066_01525 [Candidatus Pacebacteria bacterium]|nr:hypothetical protein [Candidatus Paceibacterota bacterium]
MRNALAKIWHYARWPLFVLVVGFIVLVAWRLKLLYETDDTNAAVAAIHANRLTEEDVFGDLPQEPDKAANDATLAGIDVNNNGIRDDVERAIYFKYQASAREAAPAFQYAKALQMEFTHVYNSATLVAVIQEESRGYSCVYGDGREEEIENLVFNTQARKDYQEEILQKYMVSYGLPTGEDCDLNL